MQINNAMDFDDLLMKSVLLLRDNEVIRRKYQDKWQYLLVDEFQDTNTAQYELLRLLAAGAEGKRNIFVVGDEDQSIYKFPRGVISQCETLSGRLPRRARDLAGAKLSQHADYPRRR